MTLRSLTTLAALFAPAVALAVPLELNHQGRLLDSTGAPLSSTEDVTFSLYSTVDATEAAWSETHSVTFEGGYYSVQLGSIEALDSDVFSGDPLYVGITVGTDAELADRHAIVSVPYAITAGSVAGGSVDASSVSISGTEVISSAGEIDFNAIVNAPANPLADLVCDDGEVVTWSGTEWICGSGNPSHTHNGADITEGKIDVERLPVGTGGTEVAAGDHTHDAAAIVTGRLDNERLPTDISANSVSAGSLTSTSHVQLGESSLTCDSKSVGAIRQNPSNNRIEACLTGGWLPLAIERGGETYPGRTCLDLFNQGITDSGVYWLDAALDGSPRPTYCDMSSSDPGWSLILKIDDTNPAAFRFAGALWTDDSEVNGDTPSTNTDASAKYGSFSDTPFTEMKACFPELDHCYTKDFGTQQANALAVFSGGANQVGGHPGLFSGWSTQPNCKLFGINTNNQGAQARFGYTANQENQCLSNDTAAGVGLSNVASGNYCGSTQCSQGNETVATASLLWVR